MPQFDLTTYSSQIFWFILCFAMLYAAMHFIILPRIQKIIAERRNLIDTDAALADASEKKFDDLQVRTNELRREASKKYHAQVEEGAKFAAKEREKSLEELKAKVDEITQKSRREIKEFLEKSESNVANAIKNLTQSVKAKIFS
jgi:F-type H+-transporting ATPase subunit b